MNALMFTFGNFGVFSLRSRDGKFIVCGSEDHGVYIWRTQHELQARFTSATRRDRSDFWESIKGRHMSLVAKLFAFLLLTGVSFVCVAQRTATP